MVSFDLASTQPAAFTIRTFKPTKLSVLIEYDAHYSTASKINWAAGGGATGNE